MMANNYSLTPVESDPFAPSATPAQPAMPQPVVGSAGTDPTGLTAPAQAAQPATIAAVQPSLSGQQPLQPASVAGAGNQALSSLASGMQTLAPSITEQPGAGGANGGISASAGIGQQPAQAASSGYGATPGVQQAQLLQNAAPTAAVSTTAYGA